MHFIIDQDIYFRPADGAMWHVTNEEEKRYLTATSSRLFTYLLEKQGQILSRDDIFQAVWENYGLHSSNNTLNQYVSLLRRTLAEFGLEAQLIKTIPKAGFLFNPDISIAREASPFPFPRKRERSHKIKGALLLLLTCAIVVVLVGVWRNYSNDEELAEVATRSAQIPAVFMQQSSLNARLPALARPA